MKTKFLKTIVSKENLALAAGLILTPTMDNFARRYVPQMTFGPIDLANVVELVGAAYLARNKSGFIGYFARGVLVANLAIVGSRLLSGGLGMTATSSTNTLQATF